jgi:hypothetical protein
MPSWTTTRLAVIVDGDSANPLTPIESFTPTFTLNTEVVHSCEATHVGWIANPDSFTFSMTVKAIGGAAAQLTRLALEGKEFEVGLYKAAGSTGNEWDFVHIVMRKCLITAANPSNATINGAPTATFSGISREAEIHDGAALTRPSFTV